MSFLDKQPAILQWMSESIVIPYVSPVDYKMHRYFVDFAVVYKTKDGIIQKALIEVKPNKERHPPKKTKNQQRFLQESETFAVNQAKWKAADAWCKERGISFLVFDEFDLGLKPRK